MYGFVTIPLYDASPTFVEEVLEFTKAIYLLLLFFIIKINRFK